MAVSPHGMLEYNRAIPHGGDTALMFAARAGDLESAKLLVAAGANVNDADAWGVSATALAAHAGFRDLVEFLLEKGADANASGAGFTALHAAIMRRDEQMVSALARPRRRSERAGPQLDADAPIIERLELQPRAGRRDPVLAGGPGHAPGHHASAGRRTAPTRSRCTTSSITPAIRSRNAPRRRRR